MKRKSRFNRAKENHKPTGRLRRSPKVSRLKRKEKVIYFIKVPGAVPPKYFVETAQGRIMWTTNKYLLTKSEVNVLIHKVSNKFHVDLKIGIDGKRTRKANI